MTEVLILLLLAVITVLATCRWPQAIFVLLVLTAPYYGFTKQFLDSDSILLAWKDVLLASLLIGVFLRLHGRLRFPIALGIFLAYCAITAAIPADWHAGLLGFRATCQWMLLAAAASSLRDPSLANRVGRALIWSGAIASVVYIMERSFFHTQDNIATVMGIRAEDRWRYNLVLDRFSLIYGNPNSLAVFLVICACFAFGWYLSQKSGKPPKILLLAGGVCIAGVLFTASRGAMPALLAALLVLGRGASKKVRRLVLLAAVACAVLLVQPDLLTQRLNETTSAAFTKSYRYQVWTGTIERAFSSYQLMTVGSGLGTYGGYVSDQSGISDVITENQYLKVLGEQGFLGLILLLVLVARMRRRGAEIRSNSEAAVPAAIAAVLTYGLFGNILDGMLVAVPFWALVGIRLTALHQRQPVVNARTVHGGALRLHSLTRTAQLETPMGVPCSH